MCIAVYCAIEPTFRMSLLLRPDCVRKQRRVWRDCAFVQACLSLRCSYRYMYTYDLNEMVHLDSSIGRGNNITSFFCCCCCFTPPPFPPLNHFMFVCLLCLFPTYCLTGNSSMDCTVQKECAQAPRFFMLNSTEHKFYIAHKC